MEDRKLLSAASIIAENALQGVSSDEWDIDGSGSANIQGFAAQFSVDQGQRVDFKIDTDADDYRIDIYRMGYYDGDGARKVATINPNASLANDQPNPITDFDTGLVDAGNWRVSASWNVPTAAVSGVYVAKLTREDGVFGESHIIFVVRDDDGHSDLLVQTSDTTWQAYNEYGGASLYDSGFMPAGRAYEVSYNRPLTTRDSSNLSFFFSGEYPMVRFLEANGYDVSYTSGIDTDRRGAELLEHRVFVSMGHDEYWSGQQRANVEAARDAGVNLAFFSGNEMFWKTRWQNSIDGSNTPYTTLVSYKETHANAKIDPLDDVWTGTWRDPRFSPPADGGRPENAVTGQIFTVNGDGTVGRSISVGAADGKLRFWRNTSVANLSGNQAATLGDYVLGYESDEDLDNGFRPAGLFRLSLTTANVQAYLQDYGSSYAPGTTTHTMTLYRAASGALVFGAGTVQYAWGLDDGHDGPATNNDEDMQQATVNLFADMGAQPGNLMSHLVAAAMSTDFLAPVSIITSPANGVTLSAGVAITISGTAQEQGGGRVAAVEISTDGGVSWHRADGRESWTYTWTPRSSGMVTIQSRAVDDSGNIETPAAGITINPSQNPGVYSFWDSGTTPSIVDSGDNQAVELGVRFRADANGFITGLRFYKASTNTGTHVANLWSNTGTKLGTATFTSETGSGWQQVNFATPIAVTAGTTYVASYYAPNGRYSVTRSYFTTAGVDNGPLHALAQGTGGGNGVYNYGGSAFPTSTSSASNYWVDVVYNTAIAQDTTAPTVTRFGESLGSGVVTTTSKFTVTFSEFVDAATINSNTVTLVRPDSSMVPSGCCPTPGGWCSGCPLLNAVNNTVINATISYDASARTATVTPNSPLAPSTVYTIIVSAGGVKDLAGNAIAVDTWSSLYTSNQPAPVLSSFWSSSTAPSQVDSGDNQAVELGLKFTADSDGSISGARFYKASGNTGTHTATLWTNGGQQLATATFTNETGSGWQQVNFATPVAITAGTTYVISYHTNSGHYSVTRNYFGSQFESGPLNAPANGGVYAYGANSAFPAQTFQGSNYFVDVIFSTTPNTDTVAPTITNFNPFGGTTAVPVNPTVKIYFSEALDTATVSTTSIKLLDGGNNSVPGTLVYDAATRTATLTPTSPLANAMTYTIFVLGGTAGIRDLAGNTMALNTTSAFTTVAGAVQDNTPPTITAFSPLDGAVAVDTSPVLTITFSEQLNAATVRSNTVYLLKEGSTMVSTTLNYNAATKTVSLTPTAPLLNSTSYTIYVLGGMSGVKDLADNALVQNTGSVFETETAPVGGPETDPPTVTGFAPSGTSVPVNSAVTITFNEALDPSSVNSTNIQLRHATTNAIVTSTVSYTAGGTVVTLTPTSPLTASTSYTIVVQGGATGVKDVVGNALVSNATAPFTTAAPSDTTAPTVGSFTPTGSSVAVNATASATFSEAMNAATINTSTVFARNASNVVVPATVAYNATTRVVTVTPSSALANSTTYTIVVKGGSAGVKDVAGNALAADATSSFTTVAPADTTPPTVTAFSPAGGVANVGTGATATVTFNEAMTASTITTSTVFLRNPSNVAVAATVAYNATTRVATITPTSALSNSTTYTIVVKGGVAGVKDTAGNALASDATSSFTTVAAPAPSSRLWTNSPTPATVDSRDRDSVELGVRFFSDVSGYITGLRFYKSSANTGTHKGNLWSASGQLLATANFTGETGSGWQQVTFANPVAITAGTTYVASYFAPVGRYSVNRNYFGSQFNSGTLHVPANGGVYAYGSGGFPNSTFQGSNYWVDVVMTTTPPVDTTAPTVGSFTPTGSSVAVNATASATFNEAMNASTINTSTVFLRNASNVVVPATVAYNATTRVVTVTPSSALANSTTYTIVVKGGSAGVKDLAGNALATDATSSFTTVAPPDTTPPTVTAFSPASGAANVATGATATVTFNEAMTASTITTSTVFMRNASNVVVAATVAYNATTRVATVTPTSALATSTTYTIVVKGGAAGVKDAAGNALASDATSSFTTAAAPAPSSRLFASSATPAIVDSGDRDSVELGVRFYSDVSGYITGLRFYKSSANTGTHKANLWTASGQLLATANFTGETGSGWQQVTFANPVAITAGTTYVASYFAPVGRYSVTRNYFGSQFDNGTLHVPANGGVYAYGSGGFPSNTFQGSNYWIDVMFAPTI